RRPQDSATFAHLCDQLDVGWLQHGGAAGSAAFPSERGHRGGRARQLRLGRQARFRHPTARTCHVAEPHRALVHRQDEDLRSRLDHDQGQSALGDGDGLDLRLQAGLRVDDLRPRLCLDRCRGMVRDRAGHSAHAHLGIPPAREARVLRRAPMAIVRRSLLMLVLTLYTSFAAGPFVWAGMMSLRTTTEIHSNHFAFPNPAHWEKFSDAWFNSNYGIYFANSLQVVVIAVVILTLVGAMAAHCLARYRFRLNR